MKKYFFLVFNLFSLICFSQIKHQAGIGYGYSFLTNLKLETGNVGLKFFHDKNLQVEYNQRINKKLNLSAGFQGMVTLYSGWVELDKSVTYYAERDHIPIFDFESAEVLVYLKKNFELYNQANTVINPYILTGLGFNFNQGNSIGRVFGIRDDNDQSFQISHMIETSQKSYIPYLRISAGIEYHYRISKKLYLGLSPFISWVGLQNEKNKTTVLIDDPVNISSGNFKRNRCGYGLRLLISK